MWRGLGLLTATPDRAVCQMRLTLHRRWSLHLHLRNGIAQTPCCTHPPRLPVQVRLTNQTRQMGLVEVLTDGQWGTVSAVCSKIW